jgi:hypothetical protein
MIFWATHSMIGDDSCMLTMPTGSSKHQDNQRSTSEHDFPLSHVVDDMRSEPLRHTDMANKWPREIGLSSY